MTSLLGRLLRLFPQGVPLEDLFTEAVARLFETRPVLCLAWLEDAGLIGPLAEDGQRHVHVASQRSFTALDHHAADSRPDLLIEVYRSPGTESGNDSAFVETVMVESKIGAKEGPGQLGRYAEHLARMPSAGNKKLVYITRGYDPKNRDEILYDLSGSVGFHQLRWHAFYRFLAGSEEVGDDSLVKEIALFMEEQGMAMGNRFSSFDMFILAALPRAFEIFDETLGGEVRTQLENFAGNKIRREAVPLSDVRRISRYANIAPLSGWDLFCVVGYELDDPDGYPTAVVGLQAQPRAVGREVSVDAMRRIVLLEDWEPDDLDDLSAWAGAWRTRSLAEVLHEEDHVAAVKRFFVESIRQLREELTAFKKERPELLWNGA